MGWEVDEAWDEGDAELVGDHDGYDAPFTGFAGDAGAESGVGAGGEDVAAVYGAGDAQDPGFAFEGAQVDGGGVGVLVVAGDDEVEGVVEDGLGVEADVFGWWVVGGGFDEGEVGFAGEEEVEAFGGFGFAEAEFEGGVAVACAVDEGGEEGGDGGGEAAEA